MSFAELAGRKAADRRGKKNWRNFPIRIFRGWNIRIGLYGRKNFINHRNQKACII